MPFGKYVRTPEIRKKISDANKGNKYWVGKHHSEEAKKKISIARTGQHPSLETRKKLSHHMIGNKNTLGSHISEEHKRAISNSCKGKKLSPRTPEHRKHLSEALKGKRPSIETIKNLSESRRLEWKNMTVEEAYTRVKKMRNGTKRISRPQKELFFLLKQIFADATLEYPIKTNESIRFADVGIPSLKIAFEYDSVYWHEKRKERDNKRDHDLAEVGWATFRMNKESLKIISQQKRFTLLKNGDLPHV